MAEDYAGFAAVYAPWAADMSDDVPFYVELAREGGRADQDSLEFVWVTRKPRVRLGHPHTRGPAAGLPPVLAYSGMSHAWEPGPQRKCAGSAARQDDSGNPYDPIAELYDAWSRSVVEDIPFYVAEARAAGGRVIELGVGTGRIALPIARAGIPLVGVDSSERMLEICRRRAEQEGLTALIDLRRGDLRRPPVEGRTRLVICPFRTYLHLRTDDERRRALRAAWRLLEPGGRLVFDVFAPAADDIAETHGRWLEREPGILERADWSAETRTFTLRVRGRSAETSMRLAWASPRDWQRLLHEAGFDVIACYGWFDRSRYRDGEDSIWIARRPAVRQRRLRSVTTA